LKKFRRRLEVRAVRNREVAAIAIARNRNRPQSQSPTQRFLNTRQKNERQLILVFILLLIHQKRLLNFWRRFQKQLRLGVKSNLRTKTQETGFLNQDKWPLARFLRA
jgi:hypothetical protein